MGLYLLGAEAGGDLPSAEGYAALLALARDGGVDGDRYVEELTGAVLGFYKPTGRSGILLPPTLRQMLTGYWTNATGAADWALALDRAGLVSTGYVLNEGTGSTITKAAGAPALLNSGPNANQSANPVFTPTTVPQRSVVVLHHRVTNFNASNGGSPIYVGANDGAGTNALMRCEFSDSGGAGLGRLWDGTAQVGGGRLTTPIDTWRTLFFLVDGRTANSPFLVFCLETGEVLAAQRDQVLTVAAGISYQCYNASGNDMQTEIAELHCMAAA